MRSKKNIIINSIILIFLFYGTVIFCNNIELTDSILINLIYKEGEVYEKQRDALVKEVSQDELKNYKTNNILAKAMLGIIELYKYNPKLIKRIKKNMVAYKNPFFPIGTKRNICINFSALTSAYYRFQPYYFNFYNNNIWPNPWMLSYYDNSKPNKNGKYGSSFYYLRTKQITQKRLGDKLEYAYWARIFFLEYILKYSKDLGYANLMISPTKMNSYNLNTLSEYTKAPHSVSAISKRPMLYYKLYDHSRCTLLSKLFGNEKSLYWVTIISIISKDIHLIEKKGGTPYTYKILDEVLENMIISSPPNIKIFLQHISKDLKRKELKKYIQKAIEKLNNNIDNSGVNWMEYIFNMEIGSPTYILQRIKTKQKNNYLNLNI
jgi:hypothetical protein